VRTGVSGRFLEGVERPRRAVAFAPLPEADLFFVFPRGLAIVFLPAFFLCEDAVVFLFVFPGRPEGLPNEGGS
jgi:hypothetical protein